MGKARVRAESVPPTGSERHSTRTRGADYVFRVGEERDHPAQEGADGGLAPGLRSGARFPVKDRVLLEGIPVT